MLQPNTHTLSKRNEILISMQRMYHFLGEAVSCSDSLQLAEIIRLKMMWLTTCIWPKTWAEGTVIWTEWQFSNQLFQSKTCGWGILKRHLGHLDQEPFVLNYFAEHRGKELKDAKVKRLLQSHIGKKDKYTLVPHSGLWPLICEPEKLQLLCVGRTLFSKLETSGFVYSGGTSAFTYSKSHSSSWPSCMTSAKCPRAE